MKHTLITTALALITLAPSAAQTHDIDINIRKPGAKVQDTMYGLFFEDINFAADGGLYGEKIANRSFEFPRNLEGWQTFGNVEIENDGPFDRCPHYVRLSYTGNKEERTGLINNGFIGGIGLTKGETYHFSVWAKAPQGTAKIRIQLADQTTNEENQEFVSQKLEVASSEWKKYELQLTSPRTLNKASLRVILDGTAPICLEHVSLFPVNTFKNRPNGMRRDIAQALADVHPGLLRFPGGCIVEGTTLASRYQWKNTIGPVENRPINKNRWLSTFEHRLFPEYYQSGGLGFFEYFQLAEDIGAEPLPVLNVGMACQFQNADDEKAHAPLDSLQPYIQDCLDLIEFANGPATSKWGKIRADMGHTAPFNMKFIAIGNEQWGELYFKRLHPFIEAIRKAHPEIQIVGTSGPDSEGKYFDEGWKAMKQLKADLVDEHFYRPESWFLKEGLRYDSYDRKGPKVFAGEYACHGKGKKWNHYEASILEAAFMTGMERNADVVYMTAYAPLLAHVDGWQWRPDLIWFDNTRSFKTVSYYVQQMYAMNKGTNVLRTTMNGKPLAGQPGQDGLFASSVTDKNKKTIIIKVANVSKTTQSVSLNLDGLKSSGTATTTTLSHDGLDDENSLDNPDKIVPQQGAVSYTAGKKGATIKDSLPPMSFRMYTVQL